MGTINRFLPFAVLTVITQRLMVNFSPA